MQNHHIRNVFQDARSQRSSILQDDAYIPKIIEDAGRRQLSESTGA